MKPFSTAFLTSRVEYYDKFIGRENIVADIRKKRTTFRNANEF